MRIEWFRSLSFFCALGIAASGYLLSDEYLSGKVWKEPRTIDPGDQTRAPSDAIVLFDGKSLDKWRQGDKWLVKEGVATVQTTDISTLQAFGDCQLHIEWAAPEKVEGSGQGRGNSGVYFMGRYEVQVLDSYQNETYFDGQAASIYKQMPPLVNACRKPGQWQTFDIIFTAPRFASDGKLEKPAYVTVLHNGVLAQNHFAIEGTTSWDHAPEYAPHAAKEPLVLQNHGNPVRYRNIWIREL